MFPYYFYLNILVGITLSVYPFDPIYYNLIDVTPNCYPMGLCTEYGEWGKSMDSIHPNQEERTLHIIRNIARLFPDEFINSKYGQLQWAYKGDTYTYNQNNYCGQSESYPTYWYSMANQLARFHQWDKLTCNVSISHNTCDQPDRCTRFGGCSFGSRRDAFVRTDGIWAKAEGVWGQNAGFSDGHCSAVFDPDYKYFGIGYYQTLSSVTTVFVKNGPPRDYPIFMAAHFDETNKINPDYYNVDGKHMMFLLGWYGDADSINATAWKAYVLYDGAVNEMDLVFGDRWSGIYELNVDYPSQCEPYMFIVVTVDGVIYRLPEQDRYFYGTSWIELETGTPNKPGIDYADCNENHYYKDDRENDEWIANGGGNITKSEITFIDHDNCQGCGKIDILENVYQDFIDNLVITTTTTTDNPRSTAPDGWYLVQLYVTCIICGILLYCN